MNLQEIEGREKNLFKLGAKHIHWMSIFQWQCTIEYIKNVENNEMQMQILY
jgi:hypothetical protein